MKTQKRGPRGTGGGDNDDGRASAAEIRTLAPAPAAAARAAVGAAVASASSWEATGTTATITPANATDAMRPASRWTKRRHRRKALSSNFATTPPSAASASAAAAVATPSSLEATSASSTTVTEGLKPSSRWAKHRQRQQRQTPPTNDATSTTSAEMPSNIPPSSSPPLLNDTVNTSSCQAQNVDDNEDKDADVDALPQARPLDEGDPDFLRRVQSRVVQQRNEGGQVVVYAEELDNNAAATEQQQQGGRLRKVLAAVAILFVLILVVSLLIVFLKESSDSFTTPGQDGSLPGGLSGQEDKNISETSIETIIALLQSYNVTENNDPSSSWSNDQSDSYRAVEWMSDNIALPSQLSPKAMVQYYALTTLYFALGGESWSREHDWLRPSTATSTFCGWQNVQCSGDESVTKLDLGT
jgi:hypothetical protein